MSDTLNYSLVTTRKAHECHACERTIPAKSQMYRWAVAQEGTVHSGYTCATCDAIVKHYPHDYWDYEMDFYRGYMTEHITNCDHHGMTPEQFLEMLNKRN